MRKHRSKFGCIFDLDGTLVDSDSAYIEALRTVGIDPHSVEYQKARKTVKSRLGKNHVSSHNRLLYFKEMLDFDGSFSPSKLNAMIQAYENCIHKNIQQQWNQLKRDQLFDILSAHFCLVILTNENTRTQLLKLSAIDPLGSYFKCLITSEEVGCEKPNAKNFLTALERLNLSASQCCMIGDDLNTDITPACELGIEGILTTEFSSNPSPPRSGMTTLSKLDELIGYFNL